MRNMRQDNVVAFVGRQNSGKTTLIVQLIEALTKQSVTVSSIKHHGHKRFEIDVPGKDSYRHHHAGSLATGVLSPDQFALVEAKSFDDAQEAVALLPASNLILIEGFRASGFPTVELLRANNPADNVYADTFISCCKQENKAAFPCAVITDIDSVATAALSINLPVFRLDAIDEICSWLITTFSKPLISVAVQAGGESKRMGQSKARIDFLGKPLIEHMLCRVAPFASDLIITTNEPESLSYLCGRYPGLHLIKDIYPKRSSLRGLSTALAYAHHDLVSVVACDMPLFDPTLWECEVAFLEQNTTDAACVPVYENTLQPLCATYRKDVCFDAIERFVQSDNQRIKDFLATLPIGVLSERVLTQAGIAPSTFININTPQELQALYTMLAQGLK